MDGKLVKRGGVHTEANKEECKGNHGGATYQIHANHTDKNGLEAMNDAITQTHKIQQV